MWSRSIPKHNRHTTWYVLRVTRGPFYKHCLTLILSWISIHVTIPMTMYLISVSKRGPGRNELSCSKSQCELANMHYSIIITSLVASIEASWNAIFKLIRSISVLHALISILIKHINQQLCTVALKGHHNISFSLHYINFDLREKNIMWVCIHNHLACIHNYLACTHKYLACIHNYLYMYT